MPTIMTGQIDHERIILFVSIVVPCMVTRIPRSVGKPMGEGKNIPKACWKPPIDTSSSTRGQLSEKCGTKEPNVAHHR